MPKGLDDAPRSKRPWRKNRPEDTRLVEPIKPPQAERPSRGSKDDSLSKQPTVQLPAQRMQSRTFVRFTHSHPVGANWHVSDEYKERGARPSPLQLQSVWPTELEAYNAANMHAHAIGSLHYHHTLPIQREV